MAAVVGEAATGAIAGNRRIRPNKQRMDRGDCPGPLFHFEPLPIAAPTFRALA